MRKTMVKNANCALCQQEQCCSCAINIFSAYMFFLQEKGMLAKTLLLRKKNICVLSASAKKCGCCAREAFPRMIPSFERRVNGLVQDELGLHICWVLRTLIKGCGCLQGIASKTILSCLHGGAVISTPMHNILQKNIQTEPPEASLVSEVAQGLYKMLCSVRKRERKVERWTGENERGNDREMKRNMRERERGRERDRETERKIKRERTRDRERERSEGRRKDKQRKRGRGRNKNERGRERRESGRGREQERE